MDLPARIGKYELQELLGGGMSRVYRARDTVIGRTVVVKILTEQASRDAEAKARFLREAQVAGNLAHDNVIRCVRFRRRGRPSVHGHGVPPRPGSAFAHQGRPDRRPELENAPPFSSDARIEHIHSHKIIHRDIKPENIQVTSAGVVKLMDFGIAKAENTQLTRPGFTLGTPYYMAPEQVRGETITIRADIYSFGVLLFELLTGVRPIEGDTVERIFYEILYHPVDLKPLETAGVPQAVADLVARCTAKEPEKRPQDFGEVCAALERAQRRLERGDAGAEPESAKPTPKPEPAVIPTPPAIPAASAAGPGRRRINLDMLLAASGLVMIVAAAWIYLSGPSRPRLDPVLTTSTGPMVLVPSGPFLAGAARRSVNVPAFYIDKTEVTNEAWSRFCGAKHKPLPERFRADHPDFPVVNISFNDAREFAAWAGKRMPTALEWEKAARGADGRIYPWGNQTEPARANVRDNPSRGEPDLQRTGSFPRGASPFQALDMIGSVWEFVDERRTPSPSTVEAFASQMKPAPTASEPWFAIRGGAYDLPLFESAVWDSGPVPARHRAYNIGFRCARNAR